MPTVVEAPVNELAGSAAPDSDNQHKAVVGVPSRAKHVHVETWVQNNSTVCDAEKRQVNAWEKFLKTDNRFSSGESLALFTADGRTHGHPGRFNEEKSFSKLILVIIRVDVQQRRSFSSKRPYSRSIIIHSFMNDGRLVAQGNTCNGCKTVGLFKMILVVTIPWCMSRAR